MKDIDKKFAKKKSKHKVLKILIGILMFYFVMCLIAFIYRKNKNYESYSQIKPTITNQIKNQTENYFKNQTEEQSKKQIENQVNNQVKSIAINEEVNNTSVEGTYIGENKSCLIMKADKTAKYYFYNVKKIVNCTWDFNIEKSKIIIKWNNQDLFIDIPIVDKYFLIYGGGIYWDDEKYEKISNNVTDLSIAKMNDMFFNPNEYYISILKSNIKMKADDYSASINSNNFHGVNFNTPTTWVKKIFDETTEGYIADEDNVMVVNFIESSSEAPEFINEKQKLIKIANAIVEAINSDGYINRVINEDSFKISSINTIKNCVFSFDASAEKDNHIYLNDCKVIVINDGIISFIYMRNKNSKINREDDSKKIFNSIQFDENIIKKYKSSLEKRNKLIEKTEKLEEDKVASYEYSYKEETSKKRHNGMDDPYIKFYNFCKAMCDELYNYGYKLDDWSQEIEEIEDNVIEGTVKVKNKNKYGTWGNYTIHAIADFNNEKIVAWDLN